jgi:hypothetical protein
LREPQLSGERRAAATEELLQLRLAAAGIDGGPRQLGYLRMNGVWPRRSVLRRPAGTVTLR